MLPGIPSAHTSRRGLSRPLVQGQPRHPPGQMAVGVIFRVLSGGGESRALSITFLWVQSPALSGNGCLSATWALWAPHIPRKARSVCRAWRWRKTPGRGGVDPVFREQRKIILLKELSSEGQGTTLFSRNPRPHPWGLPVCGERSPNLREEAPSL